MSHQLAVLVFHANSHGNSIDLTTFKHSENQAIWAFDEIERLVKEDKMAVESDSDGRRRADRTTHWPRRIR